MQDISRKKTEDEIALLLGDGKLESKIKARALVFSIERTIAPLAERIEKLEARSANVSKVAGAVGIALSAVAGGATMAAVQAISSREALQVVDNMRSTWSALTCEHLLMAGKFNIQVADHPQYRYLDDDRNGIACERVVPSPGNLR